VQVSLKFGKGSVSLEIPTNRLLGVLKPAASAPRGRNVPEALASPLGTEILPKLLDRNDRVAVVVSDVTRPCPTRRILPHVMRLLKASGVSRGNTRIIFGTGTHRRHTPAERRKLLGTYARSIPQVIDHTSESAQYVGTTSRGTKVLVNPALLDVDHVLAIGNVDVHYFAGYTGGYKAVIPGVAGKETIERNHSLMTLPNAEPGVSDGNPVREDLEEAGALVGLRFVVNVALDEKNRVISAFAGDPIAAHRACSKTVDRLTKVHVEEPADIVIASAGGYPRDINLYQAHKAIENASHAVKDGGVVIVLAECAEGFGNATFESWTTNATSLEEVRENLSKKFVLGAHKTYALSKIAKRAEIVLVSDKLGKQNSVIYKTFKKPREALDYAWRSRGTNASVLLMPYAMNVLPSTHV
jgi:nickel-dependent lactate racemase